MTLARVTLEGVSVVVTRPEGDADELGDALRAAGARVVAFPVVEVADPEDGGAALASAVATLARYEWVAFTSANAVRRLLARVADAGELAGAHLAAVGPATAAALVAHHLTPDLVAQRSSAQGLADLFPSATPPCGAVLFPASAGARSTLPDALRAKGWEVDEVVAYRTVPAPAPSPSLCRELAGASAVTFASPSAVEAYVALRAGGGQPLPVPPVVACIGPVTAAAARAAGLTVGVVAPVASASALAGALLGVLADVAGGATGGGVAGRGAAGRDATGREGKGASR